MKLGLVFGGKCTELQVTFDHTSSSWKTCQLSLFADLTPSPLVLPKSGMSLNGKLFERATWAHHTKENGGLLSHIQLNYTNEQNNDLIPTPTATNIQSHKRRQQVIQLAQSNLPIYSRTVKGSRQYTIMDWITYNVIKQHNITLPTPTCNDLKNDINQPQQTIWNRHSNLVASMCKLAGYDKHTIMTVGDTFQLNPRFVEEMMGFPINHTAPLSWEIKQ